MDIRIRNARQNDADAIVSLTEELGYRQTVKEIKEKVARISIDPEQKIFIAEADKTLGWMHVALTEPLESQPFVEIRGIVVSKENRGKGVGTILIQTAEQWTRDIGCKWLRIRTNITRKETREYYKKLGFISQKTQEVFEKEI